MAKLVFTNAVVTINSIDLSDSISSVVLNSSIDSIETTAFSTTGARTRIGGLADNSITLEFHQDYASGEVEATIFPLIGTVTTVTVKPTSAATSATNPIYTASCLVAEWSPVGGSVGELASVSASWPVSGAITKATS
jgi:hypothetical protein